MKLQLWQDQYHLLVGKLVDLSQSSPITIQLITIISNHSPSLKTSKTVKFILTYFLRYYAHTFWDIMYIISEKVCGYKNNDFYTSTVFEWSWGGGWWLITTTGTYHNHLQSQFNPENLKNSEKFYSHTFSDIMYILSEILCTYFLRYYVHTFYRYYVSKITSPISPITYLPRKSWPFLWRIFSIIIHDLPILLL